MSRQARPRRRATETCSGWAGYALLAPPPRSERRQLEHGCRCGRAGAQDSPPRAASDAARPSRRSRSPPVLRLLITRPGGVSPRSHSSHWSNSLRASGAGRSIPRGYRHGSESEVAHPDSVRRRHRRLGRTPVPPVSGITAAATGLRASRHRHCLRRGLRRLRRGARLRPRHSRLPAWPERRGHAARSASCVRTDSPRQGRRVGSRACARRTRVRMSPAGSAKGKPPTAARWSSATARPLPPRPDLARVRRRPR